MIKKRLNDTKNIFFEERTVKSLFFSLGYAVLLNILSLFVFPVIFAGSYGDAYALDYSILRHIICLALSCLICAHLAICMNRKRISDIILALLDFLYFLPGLIHLFLTEAEPLYRLYFVCYYLLTVILNEIIPQTKGLISKIPIEKIRNKLFPVMCVGLVLMSVGITAYVLVKKGVSLSNIMDIYANRKLMKSLNLHWIITSIINCLTYVFPVLIAWALIKRKYIPVALFTVCQCSLFLIGSNRMIIFNLGMALFIGLFNSDSKRFTKVYAVIMLLCFVEVCFGKSIFVSDVMRRMQYVPNIISEWYYEYFSNPEHPFDYAISLFPRIARVLNISSPYTDFAIAQTVGRYFGSDETVANTGLAGGGFALFGWLGLIISPLAYVLAYRIIDSFTERLSGRAIKMTVAIILVNNIINANSFFSAVIKPYSAPFLFLCCLMFIPATEDTEALPDKRVASILSFFRKKLLSIKAYIDNAIVRRTSARYRASSSAAENTVLFITFADMQRSNSGSGVRPIKMYEAFIKKGYDVMLLSGYQRPLGKRAENVKRIIKELRVTRPLFCYIESDVIPLMGFWDRVLLIKLHYYGVQTGYFMRDAYFIRGDTAIPNTRTGIKKYLFAVYTYLCVVLSTFDTGFLRNYISRMYFVSETFRDTFDFQNTALLPPAAEDNFSEKTGTKNCIYVGGLSYRYGTDLIIDAFKAINEDGNRIPLTLICREAEYTAAGSPSYPWLTVVHASGEELEPYYAQAGAGIIALRPTSYNNFAIPIKYYEYIGHGLPVVAVECHELKKEIEKSSTGIVCEPNAEKLAAAVKRLFNEPELYSECCKNVKSSLSHNLWESRVDSVVADLTREIL